MAHCKYQASRCKKCKLLTAAPACRCRSSICRRMSPWTPGLVHNSSSSRLIDGLPSRDLISGCSILIIKIRWCNYFQFDSRWLHSLMIPQSGCRMRLLSRYDNRLNEIDWLITDHKNKLKIIEILKPKSRKNFEQSEVQSDKNRDCNPNAKRDLARI